MRIEFQNEVTSTNDILINEHPLEDMALVAFSQTKGKGRKGREFFSPSDTGLYMSIILHPECLVQDAIKLTTIMAVAACRAIDRIKDDTCVTKIKWVNDIYMNEKKIAGILTERSPNKVNGVPDFLVVGIGINVFEPDGGFPDEIRNRAGAIFDNDEYLKTNISKNDARKTLAYYMVEEFMKIYESFPNCSYEDEYINRSMLIGRNVCIVGGDEVLVESIDSDLGLVVRHKDGTLETLTAGEVSLVLQ